MKKYRSTYNHLRDFINSKKNKNWSSIGDTISKYIKALKSFLNYAIAQGYTRNMEYKKFGTKEDEGEVIFLTCDQLNKLYSMNIEKPCLSNARGVFCFGCFTGLRYSDILVAIKIISLLKKITRWLMIIN